MRKSSALCVSAIAVALAMVPLKASAQALAYISGPVTRVMHIQLTPVIMVVIPLTVTLIRATVTLIRAMVMAMGVHMSGPIGAKADALPGELIGDGTVGIRA